MGCSSWVNRYWSANGRLLCYPDKSITSTRVRCLRHRYPLYVSASSQFVHVLLSASMFVCMCGQEPVAKSCHHRGIDRVVQLVPHITLDKAVSLLLHDGDCSWPMKSAFAVHYTEVSGPLLCTCFPYSAVFCSTPQQSQMDLRNMSSRTSKQPLRLDWRHGNAQNMLIY